MVTPRLTGTLMPGVTRDTLLTIAVRLGYGAREERISLDQWQEGSVPGGAFKEAFACGTAAVVTPIRRVRDNGGDWMVGDGQPGPFTTALRRALADLQRGAAPDPDGWLCTVASTGAAIR